MITNEIRRLLKNLVEASKEEGISLEEVQDLLEFYFYQEQKHADT